VLTIGLARADQHLWRANVGKPDVHVLIDVVSLACVPTPSACSVASVSGSKGADSALYTTPKHTLGVTFVLGCTTGSPSLSVCFGSLYNLVEELVVSSRFIFYLVNKTVFTLRNDQICGSEFFNFFCSPSPLAMTCLVLPQIHQENQFRVRPKPGNISFSFSLVELHGGIIETSPAGLRRHTAAAPARDSAGIQY
jgi:hypothetical protein